MANRIPFSDYIRDLRANVERGDSTEHTHRPALKALLEAVDPDIVATNEPRRIACGAPDFNITRNGVPVGHIETKDIGISIDEMERGKGPNGAQFLRYAILHSPTYRERYAEFLKIDFPRLPLPTNRDLFFHLAAHGADLVALHLLQSPKLDQFITEFPEKGTNEVDRVIFIVGGASSSPLRTREQDAPATMAQAFRLPSAKVVQASRLVPACRDLPNPNEARQAGAASSDHSIKNQKSAITNPCVWSFRIGGYQVCEKWLKDCKGRTLDYSDIQHYQRIVVAVSETIRLMGEIDRTIASHGGWPDAIGGGSSVGAVVFECETC